MKDIDIPAVGRNVQCGYCSVTWLQLPITAETESLKLRKIKDNPPQIKEGLSVDAIKASDGKTYKFLGTQWALLLPSGKTGIFAKKKIGAELDKIAGITRGKSKVVDPSSESQIGRGKLPEIYKPKNGIGFFGYIFILLIISLSLLGAIKTFEDYWLDYFPQHILFFAFIDQQLDFFVETVKNMITIVNDLVNSY